MISILHFIHMVFLGHWCIIFVFVAVSLHQASTNASSPKWFPLGLLVTSAYLIIYIGSSSMLLEHPPLWWLYIFCSRLKQNCSSFSILFWASFSVSGETWCSSKICIVFVYPESMHFLKMHGPFSGNNGRTAESGRRWCSSILHPHCIWYFGAWRRCPNQV